MNKMAVTFEQVRKYLEEDKQVGQNQKPSHLAAGGKKHPPDLSDKIRFNKQVVLIAHEFKKNDWEIAYRNIKYSIAEFFNLDPDKIGVFYFDNKPELETILNQLAEYLEEEIDLDNVIHTVNNYRREETLFYLYLPIIEQRYFA